ncbi:MAG: hypothetical protein K8T10_16065 [Candidatus Eremiobacteraeota bacterium]|nr:hypothetical protein [Candidatus Eremiobacteraeota bacterium]
MGRHCILSNKKSGTPGQLLRETKSAKNARQLICIRFMLLVMKTRHKIRFYEIARFFGVNPKTANRRIRPWNEGGVEALTINPQHGSPEKFRREHGKRGKDLIDNQEKLNTRLHIKGLYGISKEEFILDFCYSTLCWNIKNMGYRRIVPRPRSYSKSDKYCPKSFLKTQSGCPSKTNLDICSEKYHGIERK